MESDKIEQQKAEPGLRYDAGKTRWDLVPPEFEEVVDVYTFGSRKYADHNWERGMSWGRVFGSLFRHVWKFWRGETIDSESGLHHMAHAAWNCIALLVYSRRGVGTDDRVQIASTVDAEHRDVAGQLIHGSITIKTHEDPSIVQ